MCFPLGFLDTYGAFSLCNVTRIGVTLVTPRRERERRRRREKKRVAVGSFLPF